MSLDYEHCDKWYIHPFYDPLTGERIKRDSKRFKEIARKCEDYFLYPDLEGFSEHDFDVYNKKILVSPIKYIAVANKMLNRKKKREYLEKHLNEIERKAYKEKQEYRERLEFERELEEDPKYVVDKFLYSILFDNYKSIIREFKILNTKNKDILMNKRPDVVIDAYIDKYFDINKEFFTSNISYSLKYKLIEHKKCHNNFYYYDIPSLYLYLINKFTTKYYNQICEQIKIYNYDDRIMNVSYE